MILGKCGVYVAPTSQGFEPKALDQAGVASSVKCFGSGQSNASWILGVACISLKQTIKEEEEEYFALVWSEQLNLSKEMDIVFSCGFSHITLYPKLY